MPFAIRNLSVLAYAQGFTLWHYKADGLSLADVLRPGFFDNAATGGYTPMFTHGDRIMVSASDGAMDLHVAASTELAGVLVEPLQATRVPA